ncbi:MAG: DMT family transporter [Salinivirgaceae bacterium]|jgi:drug/metabolite transporter (DMT)-like permease|nr:DMT family transporter [Salinivirgaceae bacterium]
MYTFWLVLVSLIWGSTFFLIKDTVNTVNESFIVFARCILAFAAMFIYQLSKNRKDLLDKKGFIYGSILGVLLAITYTSQTIGLKFTSTGHSAFITSSAVIAVPFILYLLYKFKILKIDIIAISIVLIGLFLLTYDFESEVNIGDLITVITALSCAFHIVLAGRYVKKANTTTIVTYQFFAASVVSLVAWLLTQEGSLHLSPKASYSLLYLGIMGTLFCYFVSVWVQKYVSSLKVAIIFSLEPVFAAVFGFFFIHEVLNFKESVGAILILVGVILHSLLKHRIQNKAS